MQTLSQFRERYRWIPVIAGLAFLLIHVFACLAFKPLRNIHDAPALVAFAWFAAALITLALSVAIIPKWQSFVGFSVILLVFWNIVNI